MVFALSSAQWHVLQLNNELSQGCVLHETIPIILFYYITSTL